MRRTRLRVRVRSHVVSTQRAKKKRSMLGWRVQAESKKHRSHKNYHQQPPTPTHNQAHSFMRRHTNFVYMGMLSR